MNSVNAKHVHRFIRRNYSTIPAAPGVKHATTGKINLLGLSLPELSDLITKSTAAKPFVAKQLYTWIYKSKVYNFEQMTNLSKELRGYLTENHGVTLAKIHKLQKSTDGTIKFLFGFSADNAGISEKPNKIVETVYIPEENRATLCVSSQYGCSLNCKFCHTGTQKFQGNLTPLEIVGQILTAENYLINNTDTPLNNANKPVISNIVFMGQGEPLMNFRNLKAAIGLLSDSGGISLSRKKITVSTSGIIKNVEKVATDLGVRLAISLHASNDKTRSLIMPINKVFGLEPLMESVRNFVKLSKCDKTKRVTFEYIMLDSVNDSRSDALELVKLIHGIPCIVNLIPFNPWPGSIFKPSSASKIQSFHAILKEKGIMVTIRTPRGLDIMAACGQLKSTLSL